MRVLFLNKYTAGGPSSRYRVLQFLPFLEAAGVGATVHALHDDGYLAARYAGKQTSPWYLARRSLARLSVLSSARQYDVVFIQKEMLPHVIDAPEWWMARVGVRYVVDLDDAIHLMYANARGGRGMLRDKMPRVLSRASLVLAGNRYLEAYARRHNERVMFFPTVVDTERFKPRSEPGAEHEPVVGWMGTPETVKYLKEIVGPLASAARRVPFSLLVVGAEVEGTNELSVHCKAWSEAGEARDLQKMEIGVMPLADDEWSKGKCSLKLLQYMSAGIASVTSPLGSAPEFVRDGFNAFFASGDIEWRDRVADLAGSSAKRSAIGANARAEVEANYSLRVWGPRFVDALRYAAGATSERPAWDREHHD